MPASVGPAEPFLGDRCTTSVWQPRTAALNGLSAKVPFLMKKRASVTSTMLSGVSAAKPHYQTG